MTPILDLQGVDHAFPGFRLEGIDLRLETGSILGLLGPSGAGKTTLMKLVMGQIPAHSGSVQVCGLSLPRDLKRIRQRVGYVCEDPPFEKRKQVAEIAEFAAPWYPAWDAGRWSELLDRFEIDSYARIGSLSRGRRSLLSLTLALSHGADLLLLDEPATGLDAFHRRQVLRLMAEYAADGDRSVVITTHQTDGLASLADRLVILDRGRIVLQEDTDELLAAWKWIRYRDHAVDSDIEDELLARASGAFGNRGLLRSYLDKRTRLATAEAAGDVLIGNATIDDILVALTGGK